MKKRLIRNGVLLFLLGLLTGLAIPLLHNPRMGLSAHMEGLLNGIFLILVGLFCQDLKLSPRVTSATLGLLLYGTYANWFFTLLAAIFGTSGLTPLTGAGFKGTSWQEVLVATGLVSLAISMITCCVLILWGLRGNVYPVRVEHPEK